MNRSRPRSCQGFVSSMLTRLRANDPTRRSDPSRIRAPRCREPRFLAGERGIASIEPAPDAAERTRWITVDKWISQTEGRGGVYTSIGSPDSGWLRDSRDWLPAGDVNGVWAEAPDPIVVRPVYAPPAIPVPRQTTPHTASATWRTSSTLRLWSSGVIG
jgi:hypothetical protein